MLVLARRFGLIPDLPRARQPELHASLEAADAPSTQCVARYHGQINIGAPTIPLNDCSGSCNREQELTWEWDFEDFGRKTICEGTVIRKREIAVQSE
jgi:hypothetical protein